MAEIGRNDEVTDLLPLGFEGETHIATLDFDKASFVDAPQDGWLAASVMPILHVRENHIRCVGTCFAISSQGLCLTARHVIEDAWREAFVEHRQPEEGDGSIYVLYSSPMPNDNNPEHYVGGLLPIRRAHINDSLDIAVITLNIPRNVRTGERLPVFQHRLGLSPPSVGQKCIALGYHSATWGIQDDAATFDQKMSASRGTVEELYLPRRDSVMAPFPCFRTSARYDGGMSGGPVITDDGLVRGVVCSSMTSDDAARFDSLASMVGAASLVQVNGGRRPGGGKEVMFLWDFITGGAVEADLTDFSADRQPGRLVVRIGNGQFQNELTP